jgi:seryl-tRNA synthetase
MSHVGTQAVNNCIKSINKQWNAKKETIARTSQRMEKKKLQ